jgi:hypothetical protein
VSGGFGACNGNGGWEQRGMVAGVGGVWWVMREGGACINEMAAVAGLRVCQWQAGSRIWAKSRKPSGCSSVSAVPRKTAA